MNQIITRAAGGSLAGLVGTAAMSLVIAAGRATRLFWTPPPKLITANVERRAGVRQKLPRPAFDASWIAAHLGYGMASGALYSLLRSLLPASPVAAGLLYGGAVWSVSYLGLMPSLGLYPWPEDDSRSRMAVMIAAHAVYGVTTAEAARQIVGAAPARGGPLRRGGRSGTGVRGNA